MNIRIEPVTTHAEHVLASSLRSQVFEEEWGIRLQGIESGTDVSRMQLLARAGVGGEAAATLTVIETTGDEETHGKYGLSFEPGVRVARFTLLAVRKPYRGIGLPLAMIADAHWRFIVPGRFQYTWLLFDANRAESCSLRRVMRFQASSQVFNSEYGLTRVLLRAENAMCAEDGSCFFGSWRRSAATVVLFPPRVENVGVAAVQRTNGSRAYAAIA
jgi:hypothetical protein